MFFTYDVYEGDHTLFLIRDRKTKDLRAAVRFCLDASPLIEIMDEKSIFTLVQLEEIVSFVKEKQSDKF